MHNAQIHLSAAAGRIISPPQDITNRRPHIAGACFHTVVKATPHNPRLTPLHVICLPAFRHITQILLDLRQQTCVEFRQSDENLDVASDVQGLCGIALKKQLIFLTGCSIINIGIFI